MTAFMLPVERSALLLIDLQKAIDHPSWGTRNKPGAEGEIGQLLSTFRSGGRPVIHIKHVFTEPGSTYRPRQVGCESAQVRSTEEILSALQHEPGDTRNGDSHES